MMGQMMRGNNFFFGRVVRANNDQMIILSENNKEITITINNDTHFPFGRPAIGDEVRCIGEWDGDNFKAYGIRVFGADDFEGFGKGNGIGGRRDGKGPLWLR